MAGLLFGLNSEAAMIFWLFFGKQLAPLKA